MEILVFQYGLQYALNRGYKAHQLNHLFLKWSSILLVCFVILKLPSFSYIVAIFPPVLLQQNNLC